MTARGKATILSPEAYCYLIDMETGDRVSFQLMPESFGESKSANYDQIPILGRSLPYLGYGNSSSRATSVAMQFHALGGKYTPQWVLSRVRFLESLVYPDYEGGFAYPPHRAMLVMGEAIGMVCVATNVSTNWLGHPWYVDSGEALPFGVEVTVDLLEWGMNEDPFGHPHDVDQARASGESNSENNSMGIVRGGGSGVITLPWGV